VLAEARARRQAAKGIAASSAAARRTFTLTPLAKANAER